MVEEIAPANTTPETDYDLTSVPGDIFVQG